MPSMDRERRETAYNRSTGTGEWYSQPKETTFIDASLLHPTFVGPFVQKVGIESEEAADLVAHLKSPEARSIAMVANKSFKPEIAVMISGVSVDHSFNITALLTDLDLARTEDVMSAIAQIEAKAREAGDTSIHAAFFVDEAAEVHPLFGSYDLSVLDNVDVRYLVYSKNLPPLVE